MNIKTKKLATPIALILSLGLLSSTPAHAGHLTGTAKAKAVRATLNEYTATLKKINADNLAARNQALSAKKSALATALTAKKAAYVEANKLTDAAAKLKARNTADQAYKQLRDAENAKFKDLVTSQNNIAIQATKDAAALRDRKLAEINA